MDYSDYNLYNEVKNDYFSRDVIAIKKVFKSVRTSEFKFFFKNLGIDTPHILNTTQSLLRNQSYSDFSKLARYLFRHGKKISASNVIMHSIFKTFSRIKNSFVPISTIFDFKTLYYYSTTFNWDVSGGKPSIMSNLSNAKLNLNNAIESNNLIKSADITPEFFYKTSMQQYNLLFSFYIYKVDKNIYKNSRGKSGKFTFVWKYVAPYKRKALISHWLMKEVRISPGKDLQTRTDFVIQKFFSNPQDTLAWRVNRFSINYVYYHLRKSLGETYKTSMK